MARQINYDRKSVPEPAATRYDRDAAVVAIREGLADAEAGRVKPAREALIALAKECGLLVAAW